MSWNPEEVAQGRCVRKGVLWNFANTEENACVRISFFNKVAGLIRRKRDTGTGVFFKILQQFIGA